jgi:CxxC-x17-CxxC domain-containing protein
MVFADKTLVCRECSKEFVFSSGEQQFFQEKGFAHDPTRCPDCRASRRSNRGGPSGGRQRRTYSVVCADCGEETEVPFEPRGDRPVYCRGCFEKHRNESPAS